MTQRISIQLTAAQRSQLQKRLGRAVGILTLSVEELEERIAPSLLFREAGALDADLDGTGDLDLDRSVDLRGAEETFDGTAHVDNADHDVPPTGHKQEFGLERDE